MVNRASWPPPTSAHQSPPSASSVVPSGTPVELAHVTEHRSLADRTRRRVVGVGEVVGRRVTDDERHGSRRAPPTVGPLVFEMSSSSTRQPSGARVPPRRALGRAEVELAGDEVAVEIGAGVVGPSAEPVGIAGEQLGRAGIGIDHVEAVVEDGDAAGRRASGTMPVGIERVPACGRRRRRRRASAGSGPRSRRSTAAGARSSHTRLSPQPRVNPPIRVISTRSFLSGQPNAAAVSSVTNWTAVSATSPPRIPERCARRTSPTGSRSGPTGCRAARRRRRWRRSRRRSTRTRTPATAPGPAPRRPGW